jgi:electron transport complex protein RnfG
MSKLRHFIEQSWLLIVSSFCFGLLIAVTNAAWSPKIEQNEKDKLNNLMRGLISEAEDFQIVIEGVEIPGKKGKITRTDIYQALDEGGETTGFAFVSTGPGFADKIKLVIAVDTRCEKFFGFKVLSSNETPGFGDRIKEDYFGGQFEQAPVADLELLKTGDAKIIDS